MIKLINLSLIFFFLVSCNQNRNGSIQQSNLEKNKELIRNFIATTDAQNFDSYDEFLSNDVVAHFPGDIDLGRKEVEENERAFAIAFPDIKRTIDDLIAEGDKVVLRETVQGTHQGEFQGIKPTGRKVQVGAIVIYRFSEGKIIESWVEADFAGLMNQLTGSDSE